MIKIRGTGKGQLEIKRCYLRGIQWKTECPGCGEKSTWQDIDGDNLNYPEMGLWFDHNMYCCECDHEWKEKLYLHVELRTQV